MTIHIHTYGFGQSLVFFHGWGFDHHIWRVLLPNLMSHYQLHLIDLPGFGGTPPLSWEDFKNELLERLPDKFVVIGWSLGGLMATRLALEASDRVTHLINIASSPRFVREKDWPGIDANVLDDFYRNLQTNPLQLLKEFLNLQLKGEALPDMFEQPPNLIGLQKGLDILINWDLRPQLVTLKMPAFYLFGRLDTITPQKVMKKMQQYFPNFQYQLFERAAHAPFLSHKDQFIEALTGFLT